jgi:putative ABC transport system substrate-binding protein
LSAKWLELLKQIAPGITRAAVIRDPTDPAGTGQFGAIQSVAPSLGVELRPVNVRDASQIERGIIAFARGTSDGLIVTGSTLASFYRDLIITLAALRRKARQPRSSASSITRSTLLSPIRRSKHDSSSLAA